MCVLVTLNIYYYIHNVSKVLSIQFYIALILIVSTCLTSFEKSFSVKSDFPLGSGLTIKITGVKLMNDAAKSPKQCNCVFIK